MFSPKQEADNSIAKFLIRFKELELLEKFINLLIQVKKSPEYPTIPQQINELILYFRQALCAEEYKKKYIAELKVLQENKHQDHWVTHQLHTGLLALLNGSLQDSGRFETNYRILKNMYYVFCAYNLNVVGLKNYLNIAFENRNVQSGANSLRQAVFNFAFEPLKKSKIEALFFLMGLDSLCLFSGQPMQRLLPEIERKNKAHRFKQLMNLIQEILIDNDFNIQLYNQTLVFKRGLSEAIQEISQGSNNLFQYSAGGNQDVAFTFSDRVRFIKILAFIELENSSYDLVVKALSFELYRNLENSQYIENILRPIVVAALDYNLERLAQLLDDIIVEENSAISSRIVAWINQYPNKNTTKLFLLEAFDELRFDYDDETQDQENQGVESKELNRAFFDAPEMFIASSVRSPKSSPSQAHSKNIAKASTMNYTGASSQQNALRNSEGSQSHRDFTRSSSNSGDIKMFGGTLSRNDKVRQTVLSKRFLDVTPQRAEKKSKLLVGAHTDSIKNVAPIGQITNYFPKFTLLSAVIERLPSESKIIRHMRGFHFYRCNTHQKTYYPVTNNEQKNEFKNEIEMQLLHDLQSPAVVALNNRDDARVSVLQSVKKLSETPCIGHKTKLHYMQQVYSNTFDRLNRTLAQGSIFPEYPYARHPFVSFGDEMIHAARYGFGQKVTGDRFQDRLPLVYYEDGSVENSFVGQLWITLQSWEDYSSLGKFHVLSEYAKGHISISDRIINERETSFWSTVSSDKIALRVPLIFPSFYGDYQPAYLEAFGIDSAKFKNFKDRLIQSFKKGDRKNDQQKILEQIENEIIDHVIQYYNATITSCINTEIAKKGSWLVYHGLSDQPVLELPSIDAARLLHIYHKHQQDVDRWLLDNMTTTSENVFSDLSHQHEISRCIRLLVSLNGDGSAIVLKNNAIAQIRECLMGRDGSQFFRLLDFIENGENEEKIIFFFKKEEEYKFNQACQLLGFEYDNIQRLMTLSEALIELFLVKSKQSKSAEFIFNRIIFLAKTLQTRFIFFSNHFKKTLNDRFHGKEDEVIHMMAFLRKKIEDYNLIESVDKESQSTVAPSMSDLASNVDDVVSRQLSLEEQGVVNTQSAFAEAINSAVSAGRQALEVAVKNVHHSDVRKYMIMADDTKDAEGNTWLHLAARAGDPMVIQEVLSKVSSRTTKNNNGLTPIHLACYSGRAVAFEAIYIDSITLDVTHLCETLRNKASDDPSKCEIINLMFSKGMNISAAELQALSSQATPGVTVLLKYIHALFVSIKAYIKLATVSARNPMLHKDISLISNERESHGKKISSRSIKLIMKRMSHHQDPSLVSLIEQSNHCGLRASAVAMIITRVHQEIPYRGRINSVIAAVIMGDLTFLQAISAYNINFNSTPNHRNTLNNQAVKKPIIFAIQFARKEIFSFISQKNTIVDHSEEEILSNVVTQYKTDYQQVLFLFKWSNMLQAKYKEFYRELMLCCQEIEVIETQLCSQLKVGNASSCSVASSSSIFHHVSVGSSQLTDVIYSHSS